MYITILAHPSINQSKLARAIGVHHSAVNHWVTGKRYPTGVALYLLETIAKVPSVTALVALSAATPALPHETLETFYGVPYERVGRHIGTGYTSRATIERLACLLDYIALFHPALRQQLVKALLEQTISAELLDEIAARHTKRHKEPKQRRPFVTPPVKRADSDEVTYWALKWEDDHDKDIMNMSDDEYDRVKKLLGK